MVEAAKIRLRPVVMTGISTAAGTLPLVLAAGPGSESRISIGVIIMFGVVIATFFTLIVIPVFYKTFGKYTGSPGFVERKLRLQEKDISRQLTVSTSQLTAVSRLKPGIEFLPPHAPAP